MKERDYYFDNLKAFLIIAVIIGNSLEHANPSVVNLHYLILVLYIFHMPLFAFVSGYFCNKSKHSTQEKVLKTFKTYLTAQVFYWLLDIIVFKSKVTLRLFQPSWTMWYLLSLTCWYIISDYIKNKKKWLITSVIVAIAIGFDLGVGSYGSISRTFFFLPLFIAGMCFKKEYIETLKKNKIYIVVGSVLTLAFLYLISAATPIELLFEYTDYKFYFENPWFPMFIRIFHYIGAFFIGSLILLLMPNKKTMASILGANSLVMYVPHAAIIKVLYPFNFMKYNSVHRIILSELIILATCIAVTLIYVKLRPILRNIFTKRAKSIDVS